jgi:sugar fermentation stimulation protein A
VHELLLNKNIPGLEEYPSIRREVKYGENSRVDFLLENGNQRLYLEVKSVHMRRNTTAVFPDCPTERGAKHMWELSQIIDENTKAMVLYIVQRDDCDTFAIAVDLDPVYAAASKAAKECGVQMMAASLKLEEIKKAKFEKVLPIID